MDMRTFPSFLHPDKARKQQTGISTAKKGMKPAQIELSMMRPWVQEWGMTQGQPAWIDNKRLDGIVHLSKYQYG